MYHIKRTLFLLSICLVSSPLFAQDYLLLSGTVIDAKTKDPLPYATVGVANKHIGTITNLSGAFALYLPDSLKTDTILVSFLGYESNSLPVAKFRAKGNKIKLKPILTEIGEVIVKPFTPLEVIERVIENYDSNYAQTPFIAKGFYLQEIIENDKFIDFIEAFVDIYTPPFHDTNDCQARLIQGRTRDDLGEIQFMKRFAEEKLEKKIRKAERKGDTIDSTANAGIQVMFGGPQRIISDDMIRQINNIYDKKTLRKFNFTFESNTFFAGRELYVIRCITKRPYNHMNIDARLYIDKESFALAKIKADMTVDIPAVAKPFLRLYRIKINDIKLNSDNEYRYLAGKWYPSKTIMTGYFDLHKKYKGKYIEHSIVEVQNAFVTTDIQEENVVPFKEDELLTDDPLSEQLGTYNPEFWKNRNRIEYKVKN